MFSKKVSLSFSRCLSFLLILVVSATLLSGCSSTSNSISEVWGRADAKEVDVNSKIPGRVISLLVKEGDTVKKGQLLAQIDKRDIIAQTNQAKANIKAIEAQILQATTITDLQDQTSKASLKTAEAQLAKAQSDLNLAATDFKRFSDLLAANVVSAQTFDTYSLKYQVAQATYTQAQAALKSAEAGLLQTNVNTANEEAMRSKLAQAQATLEQIEVALDEAEIRAPFAGIITTKYVEEGAMISSGMPLVAVQDPLDNWVNIKVKETELSKYTLNQPISLQGRDSKLRLAGKITDISKKPEFATYRATNERSENDIITFNIKIQVNSDKVRPGMRFRLVEGEI